MELPVLARGMLVGLGIAAPVGPIGLLVIQRTLAQGRLVGLASGLGAATADLLYGLVAVFGLTLAAESLAAVARPLGMVGGLVLLWMGVTTFRKPPAQQAAAVRESGRRGLAGAWASTFLLTLTNPMTVFAFAAILAGAGLLQETDNGWTGLLFVLGVGLGSALWWLLLSGGVALLRERVTPAALLWVNRGAGLLLAAFGLYALYGALFGVPAP